MFKPLLAAGIVATTLGHANAAVFADRATFEDAMGIVYTETFESLTPGTYDINGPTTLPTGLVVSPLTSGLFAVSSGYRSNPTQAIGYFTPGGPNFALGGSYFAFGGDFFNSFFGGSSQSSQPINLVLYFFDNGSLVDSVTAQVAASGGSFIGYTGSAAFDSVRVLALSASFGLGVADNISVGNPIPEPTSLALTGLGIAAVLSRRNAKSA